jgi:hypothetical protein
MILGLKDKPKSRTFNLEFRKSWKSILFMLSIKPEAKTFVTYRP